MVFPWFSHVFPMVFPSGQMVTIWSPAPQCDDPDDSDLDTLDDEAGENWGPGRQLWDVNVNKTGDTIRGCVCVYTYTHNYVYIYIYTVYI